MLCCCSSWSNKVPAQKSSLNLSLANLSIHRSCCKTKIFEPTKFYFHTLQFWIRFSQTLFSSLPHTQHIFYFAKCFFAAKRSSQILNFSQMFTNGHKYEFVCTHVLTGPRPQIKHLILILLSFIKFLFAFMFLWHCQYILNDLHIFNCTDRMMSYDCDYNDRTCDNKSMFHQVRCGDYSNTKWPCLVIVFDITQIQNIPHITYCESFNIAWNRINNLNMSIPVTKILW